MIRGAQKIKIVYYFTINPSPVEDYYYEEDDYAVNDPAGGL